MINPVKKRFIRYWHGGLISGIGSLFGASINAASQEKMNRDNIEAQKEENALNRQFTEDMYNKYESPVAQAQQMREAGLNPMGAISPQSVGSASTSALPAGQAPQWGNALQAGIESFWSAGRAIREQRLLDQEIDSKILENWMKEFENGTADERFRAEMEKLTSESGKTREERRVLRDQRKQLELEYKMAKEAYDNGINSHVDAHNESEARVGNLKSNTTATSDANTRANEIHDLNKQLMSHQISIAEYEKRILDNDAYKSDTDRFIRTLTGIDMDKLNPILVPLVYQFGEAERNGKLTDEAFSQFVESITSYLSAERTMFLKKDPDYITALQFKQLSLEKRKQLFSEVVAQFNAEVQERGLELKAIEIADDCLNIFK